jgi:predicted GH43/DUF377 family glycosyl hydrolase
MRRSSQRESTFFRLPVPWNVTATCLAIVAALSPAASQVPEQLQPWLAPQNWERDSEEPILSLGKLGDFDDTHIFAPMVAVENGRYFLWYCGSQGFAYDLSPTRTRDERVFELGLATSSDGKRFEKHPGGSVYSLDREKRLSILTPTILRNADGTPLREDGRLQMWFSSATLGGGGQVQSIQRSTSKDGIEWSQPSRILVDRAYAPSVIKTEKGYEMWYTVPGRYPWVMRHARSDDGLKWDVTAEPVMEISQDWEHFLQIYPAVSRIDAVYLMWYASYLSEDRLTTAIGFAASVDGIHWHKHPQNPVLQPEPKHDWESHYVSSQSVSRLADGSFRMWYASRKAPPFRNLYFALGTARWAGPPATRDSE